MVWMMLAKKAGTFQGKIAVTAKSRPKLLSISTKIPTIRSRNSRLMFCMRCRMRVTASESVCVKWAVVSSCLRLLNIDQISCLRSWVFQCVRLRAMRVFYCISVRLYRAGGQLVGIYQLDVTSYSTDSAHNYYMTVTVKVQLRDKLYKLAHTVSTLQQVAQQMLQRFPSHHLRYYHQGIEVTDLAPLLAAASAQHLTSIKLLAKTSHNDSKIVDDISMVAYSDKNDSSVISLLVEEPAKLQEKRRPALPADFYLCYNCEGKGTLNSMSMLEVCPICKGAGQLEETHKYVNRLRELYFSHFRPEFRAETILQELREERVPERKGSLVGMDKKYQVIVRQTSKKENIEVGKVFSMRFEVKNIGPSWKGKSAELIEMGEKKGKTLSAIETGQTLTVEVGPFVCSSQGQLQKTYTLCFREGEELTRFGHKFGFSVRGFKSKPVRKVVCSQRERIRDLKLVSGSNKSEEYLMLKLKSMGIDVMNLELEDEVIIEVIRQFK